MKKEKVIIKLRTDKELASSLLKEIYQNIDRPNKDILLEAEDYCDTDGNCFDPFQLLPGACL